MVLKKKNDNNHHLKLLKSALCIPFIIFVWVGEYPFACVHRYIDICLFIYIVISLFTSTYYKGSRCSLWIGAGVVS